MAPASPPARVSLEVPSAGRAFFHIAMAGHVTGGASSQIYADVLKRIEHLEGRPFGLLFDLRDVKKFDEPAANTMQQLEMDAASRGLEVVAHLVTQPKLVEQLDAEMKQLNAENLIGNFTDERKAKAFVTGASEVLQ